MPMAKSTSIISGRSSPPPPCCMNDRNALRILLIGLVTFSPYRQQARHSPASPSHYLSHSGRLSADQRRHSAPGLAACSFLALQANRALNDDADLHSVDPNAKDN